jgi:hypothetical protein
MSTGGCPGATVHSLEVRALCSSFRYRNVYEIEDEHEERLRRSEHVVVSLSHVAEDDAVVRSDLYFLKNRPDWAARPA